MEDKEWVLKLHAKAFNINPSKSGTLLTKLSSRLATLPHSSSLSVPVSHRRAFYPHAANLFFLINLKEILCWILQFILDASEDQETAMKGLQGITETAQQFSSLNWTHLHSPDEKIKPGAETLCSSFYIWKFFRMKRLRYTISAETASVTFYSYSSLHSKFGKTAVLSCKFPIHKANLLFRGLGCRTCQKGWLDGLKWGCHSVQKPFLSWISFYGPQDMRKFEYKALFK